LVTGLPFNTYSLLDLSHWNHLNVLTVQISTESELDREIKRINALFQKKETEETWEQFDVALKNVAKWTKEGATSMEGFIPAIKTLKEPIVKSVIDLF
jgi:hypothetical protein